MPLTEIGLKIDKSKLNQSMMLTSKMAESEKPKPVTKAPMERDKEKDLTSNKLKSLLSQRMMERSRTSFRMRSKKEPQSMLPNATQASFETENPYEKSMMRRTVSTGTRYGPFAQIKSSRRSVPTAEQPKRNYEANLKVTVKRNRITFTDTQILKSILSNNQTGNIKIQI